MKHTTKEVYMTPQTEVTVMELESIIATSSAIEEVEQLEDANWFPEGESNVYWK